MAGGRSIKAGEAYVEVGIRNRIAAGAKGVQSDLDKMGRKATALGSIMTGVGTTLGLPFAFAAGKLASFDDAMRMTGAVSQATDKQLSMLTDTAKELGRTTSFTAVDVALLMGELGKAGFDPSQVEDMTGAVLNLARATGTDATLSAGIMAATIRQYGLAATDAARVSDVLTMAANASFNSVESLGEALSYAGPVAADFGMSIEETSAILGTLGNVGIQGSMAGTAIRRLLTLSGAEAEKLEKIFGVSFADAAGNARPLIDSLADVAEATNGLGTATRAAKFNEAFGLLGITGASAISKTAASTRELLTQIQESGGVAATTAQKMDAGLGGSFRMIMSAAEGAAIAVGESFGGSLQSITDTLTESITGFTGWIEENESLVAALAGTTAALVLTGVSLATLGVTSQLLAAGIGTLSAVAGLASGVMAGLSVATSAVQAITLVTAGTFAAMSGSSTAMATGIALVSAAYSVSPVAAGVAISAWGMVGAVLTALAAPSTLAATLGGVVSTAWATAAGVVASAWAVITGPILPFIAAGALAVAVVGSLVGVAAYAAVAGMDFGKAWGIAGDTVSRIVGTVKDAFTVIRDAMGSGDYSTAAEALWLGVQAVFWDGVDGTMKAFSWLWDEAWATGQRFFSSLVSIAWKAAKALASAILNPFEAAKEIGRLMGELAGSATGFNPSGKASAAKQELTALREALAVEKDRKTLSEEAAKINEASRSQEEKTEEKMAEIDRLEKSGALTKGEADKARESVKPETTEIADSVASKVKELELEIMALEQGEDAADRKRMADEGLTEAQIKQIEVLKEKKKAIEEVQEAEKKASQQRIDAVLKRGDQLAESGVSPKDVFDRVMSQINADQNSGLIDSDAAEAGRGTARKNLDSQIESLRAEGKALADSLRTPGEILNDKLKEISRLSAAGVVPEETALRAEDKARQEFAETQASNKKKTEEANSSLEQELKRSGPTGTFSASAAAMIGGPQFSFDKESLKYQQSIAANTAIIAKQSKKDNVTRFG